MKLIGLLTVVVCHFCQVNLVAAADPCDEQVHYFCFNVSSFFFKLKNPRLV
jgi:hypothetical protein